MTCVQLEQISCADRSFCLECRCLTVEGGSTPREEFNEWRAAQYAVNNGGVSLHLVRNSARQVIEFSETLNVAEREKTQQVHLEAFGTEIHRSSGD